jgi:hypothetical protein
MRSTQLAVALVGAALSAAGCAAGSGQLAWAPGDLRRELSRRIPADEVMVPFELSPEHVRRARALVAYTPSASEKEVDAAVEELEAAARSTRPRPACSTSWAWRAGSAATAPARRGRGRRPSRCAGSGRWHGPSSTSWPPRPPAGAEDP